MKKLLYFAMALGLVACQTENVDVNGGKGDAETSYLAINIVPAPDQGTRAEGGQASGQPGDATYEEGYAAENKIESVRFYFFNEGAIAAVKDEKNYFDWKPTDTDVEGPDMPNVEKQLKAVVVIETPKGDGLPKQIVAVINPDAEGLGEANLTLAELRDRTKNYVEDLEDGFVMTNAVYKAGTAEVATTAVTSANYAPTPDAAKANPVNIYVERNVAKVRVKFGEEVTVTQNRIALTDSKKQPITVSVNGEDKQVYLELGKWNLTAQTDKGYFSKHVDASWNDNTPFANWNYAPYFRSFWAQNTEDAEQFWYSYNEIASKGGKDYGDTNNTNVIYTNENAPQVAGATDSSVEKFTKVILAGKLVYQDGEEWKPLEITKYAGITSVGEAALKTTLLNNIKDNKALYSYVETADDVTFSDVLDSDIKFKTALESEVDGVDESETTTGRYNVYLQLTEEGAKKNWAKTNVKETYKQNLLADEKAVNEYLVSSVGKAQVFATGLTYYYFPIEHLNPLAEGIGHYGVVRNHIYDCTINAIYGLGTPVYNPEQTIYPEHPQQDETYIAARINILSWRLVNHSYDLDWSE